MQAVEEDRETSSLHVMLSLYIRGTLCFFLLTQWVETLSFTRVLDAISAHSLDNRNDVNVTVLLGNSESSGRIPRGRSGWSLIFDFRTLFLKSCYEA